MSEQRDALKETSSSRALSRDVALAAGVSQSTVSRALRDDPRISSATRKRVQQAAEQLGYVPNRMARNLRERRSRVVGVMVQDIDNAFYPQLLADMHQELLVAGYAFTLIVDPLHLRSDVTRLRNLLDASLDGLIITTATLDSDAPQALHRRGIPIVLSVRSIPGLEVDIVESDNVAAGQLAARHLVSLGHRDIAAIMGPEVTSTTQHRIVGAKQVPGLSLPPERVFYGPYSHESGHAHCRRLLQSDRPPTAIMAANDVIAIGVIDAARQMGYSIPDDISVIGFDDIHMASWHSFRLTTVRQDTKGIAVQSARRLIERIEDPDGPVTHDKYPVSLTMRATTAPPK
ncbi:MAG: LacI family DNA-binding transcriptional regulator [bacterium]|nr:LacI family DNA-binding transcriptional regulator [bacterium]MCY3889144.1 LacI family DNA-binding transcriptional regulator [bacterium]